ncbi:MAG: CvpA family protein [Pseudomonadales bacterium]|jgi:membrane protein required for colicin V production|nr:CvpA family protein [Pseudomonadales bacterium]
MSLNMADIVIIAVIALSGLIGIVRGLVREVMSLAVWVLAAFFAAAFDERAAPWFSGVIASPPVQQVAGFALMFVLGIFIGGVITNMAVKMTSAIGLGPPDSALGMLFGILRGILLVTLVVVVSVRFDLFSEWYADSSLVPYLLSLADYLAALAGLDPSQLYPHTPSSSTSL